MAEIVTDEKHPLPTGISLRAAGVNSIHQQHTYAQTLPEPFLSTFKRRILVCSDESKGGDAAFKWACEHIIKKDDLLIVARIINPTEVTDMLYWDKITETNNLRESLLKTSADLLQFYSELSPIKDISILVDVKIGDAKTGICDIAKDMDVDMVVLGSRGHGIVKRLLVGSVSSYLVHHLDRPIVVVKQT